MSPSGLPPGLVPPVGVVRPVEPLAPNPKNWFMAACTSPDVPGVLFTPACVEPNCAAYSGDTDPPVSACNVGNCCPTAAVVEAFCDAVKGVAVLVGNFGALG